MANSGASSSAGHTIPMSIGLPISDKLTKTNLVLWEAQVLPAIRGAQLEGYLNGTTPPPEKEINVKSGEKTIKGPNPAYAQWVPLTCSLP